MLARDWVVITIKSDVVNAFVHPLLPGFIFFLTGLVGEEAEYVTSESGFVCLFVCVCVCVCVRGGGKNRQLEVECLRGLKLTTVLGKTSFVQRLLCMYCVSVSYTDAHVHAHAHVHLCLAWLDLVPFLHDPYFFDQLLNLLFVVYKLLLLPTSVSPTTKSPWSALTS